jgi:hypothetical protein
MTLFADDPGSLDRLHDLAVPPPVPWWPPAPAWYAVGAAALGLLAVLVRRLVARWRRNRYRRAALAELDRAAASVPGMAVLIKRVALAAYPRERVASLSGGPWLAFLDETGRTEAFTRGPGRIFGDDEYGANPPPPGPDLVEAVRAWVRHHRTEGP